METKFNLLKEALASGKKLRTPVGVIGPREATEEQLATAKYIGSKLAELGVICVCGGRQGVMEAVSEGVTSKGGFIIGLTPERDWKDANEHCSVVLATGIGIARNAIIACASNALIAVGGGYGTTSEVAYGLQFEKPVFTICDAPVVDGVRKHTNADELIEELAEYLLNSIN